MTDRVTRAPEAQRDESAYPTTLPEGGVDLVAATAAYRRALVVQALERTQGNVSAAARLLGLQRTTLHEQLRRSRLAVKGGAR